MLTRPAARCSNANVNLLKTVQTQFLIVSPSWRQILRIKLESSFFQSQISEVFENEQFKILAFVFQPEKSFVKHEKIDNQLCN
jgi:hypothetical protein